MDALVLIAVMAIPIVVFGFLISLYYRWARKHDPMTARARDGLPMDHESKRPEVYHD